jgi:hypothetical protein
MTGIAVWEYGRYRFEFDNGGYMMDGKRLRITPAEERYLYERLVLYKPPKETAYRYAIQRLRERHGADFLAEVFTHGPSGGAEGTVRREAFERILQEYLEKDGRTAYIKWGYRFDFLNGSYAWDGGELHVTPKEAVFLYERTVLGLRGRRGKHRHTAGSTLYDMRRKFGRRFLHEVFPSEETPRDAAAIGRQQAANVRGAASTDGQTSGTL